MSLALLAPFSTPLGMTGASFKDHFSKQAADYATFRPRYPQKLFEYLGSIAPSRRLAWDCGTGNGQAAVGLASTFHRVIATDASEKQIANAQQHERIDYRVASAEDSGIQSEMIDLIMVAQALHWFDLDRFYDEARRVLKRDGVLAALVAASVASKRAALGRVNSADSALRIVSIARRHGIAGA